MSRVLGVDSSLVNTGICVLSDPGVYTFHSIKGKKLRDEERLEYFKNEFQSIIDNHKPFDLATVEDYAMGALGKTFTIGELGGLLKLLLYENKIPFVKVAPPQVKKFASGKGVGEKGLIIKHVYQKWGVDVTDNNLGDAYTLAKIAMAIVRINQLKEFPKYAYETAVVKKILNIV